MLYDYNSNNDVVPPCERDGLRTGLDELQHRLSNPILNSDNHSSAAWRTWRDPPYSWLYRALELHPDCFSPLMIIELTLLPARRDPPVGSSAYQAELGRFEQSLIHNIDAVEVSSAIVPAWLVPASWILPTMNLQGDFIIKLLACFGPALGTVIGAWLHARYGRKVRLKIGEIEAEAQTVEEVERLLGHAEEISLRLQPCVTLSAALEKPKLPNPG